MVTGSSFTSLFSNWGMPSSPKVPFKQGAKKVEVKSSEGGSTAVTKKSSGNHRLSSSSHKHPLVEVLGHVMEFSQAKEIINLYFLLNKEVNKQALEILGLINRPFEAQLKRFKPLEATAILR